MIHQLHLCSLLMRYVARLIYLVTVRRGQLNSEKYHVLVWITIHSVRRRCPAVDSESMYMVLCTIIIITQSLVDKKGTPRSTAYGRLRTWLVDRRNTPDPQSVTRSKGKSTHLYIKKGTRIIVSARTPQTTEPWLASLV